MLVVLGGGVLLAAILAPAGIEVVLYTGVGNLPHFNPDLDTGDPPEAVKTLRQEIGLCSGLLILDPDNHCRCISDRQSEQGATNVNNVGFLGQDHPGDAHPGKPKVARSSFAPEAKQSEHKHQGKKEKPSLVNGIATIKDEPRG